MIARPFQVDSIDVLYVGGFVSVTVHFGRDGIWTRTVEKHQTEKLRRWVLESDLSLAAQNRIDRKLCDIEDRIIDEDAAKRWSWKNYWTEVFFWVVLAVCAVSVIYSACSVWNY